MTPPKTAHPAEEILHEKIADLLRTALRHGVYIAGFAFANTDSGLITNFGNCNDAGDAKLFKLLCEFCDKRRASGYSNTIKGSELN